MRITEILAAMRAAVLAYPLRDEHKQLDSDALHLSQLLGGDGVADEIDPGAHLSFDVFRPTAAESPARGSRGEPPRLESQIDLVVQYSVRHDQQRDDYDRALGLMDDLTVHLYDLDLGVTVPAAEITQMLRVSDVVAMPGRDSPYILLVSTFTVLHDGRA